MQDRVASGANANAVDANTVGREGRPRSGRAVGAFGVAQKEDCEAVAS